MCFHLQALFGHLTLDVIILTILYSLAGLGIAIVNDFKSIEGDRYVHQPAGKQLRCCCLPNSCAVVLVMLLLHHIIQLHCCIAIHAAAMW